VSNKNLINVIIIVSTLIIFSIVGVVLQLKSISITGATVYDCGDGLIDIGEECDDGNSIKNDGCSLCKIESGSTCNGEPSICNLSSS
jgi:cysteine-rich repeat protein